MTTRKYTPRLRAEQQQHTRVRIVEATVALHEELGPKNTTISAIAERAGVQRLTVYRHFPDDDSLLAACSTRWTELNPPPDPSQWRDIRDPAARCRAALAAFYGYYRRTERMWSRVQRDAEEMPAVKAALRKPKEHLGQIRDDLTACWTASPSQARALGAVLGHGLRFSTWRSLNEEGLKDAEMADLAVRWLLALARADAPAD